MALLIVGRGAQAQNALQQARARGEIVIDSDATYPPFEEMVGNRVEGFDVDIGTEIGKELGIPVRFVNTAWDGVFPALKTGKCDLVMSGVTITDERKKGNAFTRPYFLSGQVIVRRKGDTSVRGPQDLPGKVCAVQTETTGQTALLKLGLSKESLHRFDTLQDALTDLRNGKSDAVVGDLPALKRMIRLNYPELEIIGGIFKQENLGIVARPADLDLVAAINLALERIMVDGRYARIYAKWMQEPVTLAMLAQLQSVGKDGSPIPDTLYAQVNPQTVPGSATAKEKGAEKSSAPLIGSALAIRPDLMRQALPLLLRGARLTFSLMLLALAIGAPLGLLIALGRVSGFAPLKALMTVYVEVVRGTPLLMQIYVIYFVFPLFGWPFSKLNPFVAGVAALSLNAAAYISEIFRAGIESIDVGQMEAARALGMDYRLAMRWVILPQTLRRVLPPLTNEAVALLKDTSLVSVVALSELMRNGKEFATNAGSPTSIYLEVALLYLAMTLPLTWLVRRLEAYWQPVSRSRKSAPTVTAARVVTGESR